VVLSHTLATRLTGAGELPSWGARPAGRIRAAGRLPRGEPTGSLAAAITAATGHV